MQRKTKFAGRDASPVLLFAIVLLLAGGIVFAVYSLRVDPMKEFLEGRVISVMYVIEEDGVPVGTFVVLYYPPTRRAAVFDVPGNLRMQIHGRNRMDRIDSVYDPENIAAFESQVGSALGLSGISFSIVMTTENLARAVDLLEGIELFVPTRVEFRDENDRLVLLPSGIHRFNGDKALTFLTHRAPGEDPEMVAHRRQRFFLSFLQRQAEMNAKLNVPEVARMYRSLIRTGLNERARVRLFDELAQMDMGRIGVHAVGGTESVISGQTQLVPLHGGNLIREVVLRTLASITRPEEGADRHFTVEVLNGTTVTGLASRTAALLTEFGYDVISIGNAEHTDFERTVLIDRSGYEAIARNFANIIRLDNIVFETPDRDFFMSGELALQHTELRSDFTLIIGRDFNERHVVGN